MTQKAIFEAPNPFYEVFFGRDAQLKSALNIF
jgi:hypothetical protein